MKSFLYGLLAVSLFVVSCEKDVEKPKSVVIEKLAIGEATISQNKKIIVWADDSLKVGYTPLYFSLQNAGGEYISDAEISLLPLMDMGTMKHSAPVVQPVYDSQSHLYMGAVVFSMASGRHSWEIEATIDGAKKKFPVKVEAEKTKTTGNYIGTDGGNYVVSLVKPVKFTTGLNNFSLLINKKESMMSFPPVEGLTIEFEPVMPSMGHGSPNNLNPTSAGKGFYNGKVNYTMTGDWRLHFKIKSGTTVLVEDATIDILF